MSKENAEVQTAETPAEIEQAPAADPAPADPAAAEEPAAEENPAANDAGNGEESPPEDQEPAAELYRPDGIEEHMIGKSDQETIDNLLKRNKGLREELGAKRGVPEKFEDYKVEFSKEEEEKYITKNEDGVDPVFELMKQKAFEKGISAEATKEFFASFAETLFSQVEEAQASNADNGDQGVKADFEFKGFGGVEKAKPVQEAATVWVDGLKTQDKLSDRAAFELKLLATHEAGLEALEQLRVLSGEKPIPRDFGGNRGGDASLTEKDLQSMMRDPKYWKEKDPVFIAKVTDGFKQLYGE